MANHHDGIVYAEHVLFHSLILLLLDLIQGPYHGIIVTLVTKRLLNVHQQVLHRDILAFIQCVGAFTRVPMKNGKNLRVHAFLIILLRKASTKAFTTGILGTGFSARLLSLWQSEAVTAYCHTSTRGRRLIVKWAECKSHSKKASSM